MSDVLDKHDVVVVGGGLGGVAAGLAAARRGLSVALVEKGPYLGGLATMGLIAIYLPICDGYGRQVVGGLAEELLHLSIKYGPGEVPKSWQDPDATVEERAKARFRVTFNPASFVLALDEVVLDAGITLYLETPAVEPIVEGRRLQGVRLACREGYRDLLAETVIDATGDAQIAYLAGAECVEGTNWLSTWFYAAGEEGLKLRRLGYGCGKWDQPRDLLGVTSQQMTSYHIESRKLIRNWYLQDGNGSYPAILPTMPQLRTIRRIAGVSAMEPESSYEDVVGRIGDWRKPAPVSEVPFSSLVTREFDNLYVIGRCMAASGDAWEIMRVIPSVVLTGEIAGTAASLSSSIEQLDLASLQKHLRDTGALLD